MKSAHVRSATLLCLLALLSSVGCASLLPEQPIVVNAEPCPAPSPQANLEIAHLIILNDRAFTCADQGLGPDECEGPFLDMPEVEAGPKYVKEGVPASIPRRRMTPATLAWFGEIGNYCHGQLERSK